jgi:putative hydrolase of the HAD superfamily
MSHYKHIFFDLDRTIWDFETNSRETLNEIFLDYGLIETFKDFETFISIYREKNAKLWQEYRNGNIQKDVLKYERFRLCLEQLGVDNPTLASDVGETYLSKSAEKTRLFPYAHETLAYLKERYYLHIITNGFQNVQIKKINNSNLQQYFHKVITSEMVGVQKPHSKIFLYALRQANAKKEASIMVGDDLQGDIKGAKDIGLDQVFFNPHGKSHFTKPSYEIHSLKELQSLF